MRALAEHMATAWSGIAANKLRSGLTMLGVVIGVGTVVALLSIGEGARADITGRITSAGTNLLFVGPGFSGRGPVRGPAGSASLTYEDALALENEIAVPDVTVVAPEYSRSAQVIHGDANSNSQVIGVTPAYFAAFEREISVGRAVSSRDVEARGDVALVGAVLAEELFGRSAPLGQRVKVALPGGSGERVSLTVVGVLEEAGGSNRFGSADEALVVPITTAQHKLFAARDAKGQALVTSIAAVSVEGRSEQATAQIDELLRRRHKIADGAPSDFSVTDQADLLELATDVTRTMTIFLGAVAVISLVVGGIGIMNIMLVSVTERTREIGIRKALGAQRSDILAQFLLEAVALSVTGGVVGVGAGIAAAETLDVAGLMSTSVAPNAIVLALAFSLAVGLVSGIYPANRAAGLQPVEALRYE